MFKQLGSSIKKRTTRFCKRLYVRSVIFNRKMNERGQQSTVTEKYIMSIARMVINHPETEFQIEPNSGKKYVKNEQIGIYIVFYKGKIEVTNHVYHYDVIVTDRNWARIINMYNNVVEKIRLEYEDEIMSNVKNSLSLIHEKILKETKK